MQGQEFSILKGNLESEPDTAERSVVWPPSLDDNKVDIASASRRNGSEIWVSSVRTEPTYSDMLSGFGTNAGYSHGVRAPSVEQVALSSNSIRQRSFDQEGRFNLLSSPRSMLPPPLLLSLDSNRKSSAQGSNISFQAQGNSYGRIFDCPKIQHAHGNWLMPLPPQGHSENLAQSRDIVRKSLLVQQEEAVKPGDGNCKLFGKFLVTPEPAVSHDKMMDDSVHTHHPVSPPDHGFESDQKSEPSRGSKSKEKVLASCETEKLVQTFQHSQDVHGKAHSGSSRSCTKVFFFHLRSYLGWGEELSLDVVSL